METPTQYVKSIQIKKALLKLFHTPFCYFHYWLWTSKYVLGYSGSDFFEYTRNILDRYSDVYTSLVTGS